MLFVSVKNALRGLLLTFLLTFQLFAQSDSFNIWLPANQGLGKCAAIGEAGGEATWYRDHFSVKQLLHKEGEMYAYVTYGIPTASDTGNFATDPYNACAVHAEFDSSACDGGLYKHDKEVNVWYRVANINMPSVADVYYLMSNGADIVVLTDSGTIYQIDENEPQGWRLLTSAAITKGQLRQLSQAGNTEGADLAGVRTKEFMGDQLYFLVTHPDAIDMESDETKEQGIIRYNYRDDTLLFDSIGAFPQQLFEGVQQHSENLQGGIFADQIAGRFSLFYAYRDAFNNDSCFTERSRGEDNVVRVLWTWDAEAKQWHNVSQGPDYINFTGSACAGTLNWITSWNKKSVFVRTQQGIYEWNGDRWLSRYSGDFMGNGMGAMKDSENPSPATRFYLFDYKGVESIGQYGMSRLGSNNELFSNCYFNSIDKLTSPDDGKTIYINPHVMAGTETCTDAGCWRKDMGVYWLQSDPDKETSPVSNLHMESATYLGGDGGQDNSPVGVGVGGDSSDLAIFVAGNFDPNIQGVWKNPGCFDPAAAGGCHYVAPWAAPTDRGKIIRLNKMGDSLISVYTIGTEVIDYEMQRNGNFSMVVSGHWGVAKVNPDGQSMAWSKTPADFDALGLQQPTGGSQVFLVDIADNGHVVVARGTANSGTRHGNVFGGYSLTPQNEVGFIVLAPDGSLQEANRVLVAPRGFKDIVIKDDTVYTLHQMQINFSQDPNVAMPECKDAGGYAGMPVQQPVLRAYAPGLTDTLWQTWGFTGPELYHDMADAMPHKLGVGKNGGLYFLGEASFGNSIFRWDGKMTRSKNYAETGECSAPNTLVMTDNYNTPFMMSGTHLPYFCAIDPQTGVVQRGQYLIPRVSNGSSNSFVTRQGYITADQDGNVYIAGRSAFQIAGRDMMHINGSLLGNYAGGDASICIVSADFSERIFWGAFAQDDHARGTVGHISMHNDVVVALASSESGKMFTGTSRYDASSEQFVYKDEWAMNETPFNYNLKDDATKVNDAWMAVWYRDVWNHTYKDTLEVREYESQPVAEITYEIMDVGIFSPEPPLCSQQTLEVQCNAVSFLSFDEGNRFVVQLSDASGSFASPVVIGELIEREVGVHTIPAQIPTDMLPGSEYRIRVVSTAPVVMSDPSASLEILGYPLAPDFIDGPEELCEYGIATYTVPDIPDYEFLWEIPLGAKFLDAEGNVISIPPPITYQLLTGNVIHVDFSFATEAHIRAYSVNSCGRSDEAASWSSVFIDSPETPEPISGQDTVLQGWEGVYMTPRDSAVVYYEWTVPSGIMVVEDNDHAIRLLFAPDIEQKTHYIQVRAVNACGVSSPRDFAITVNNFSMLIDNPDADSLQWQFTAQYANLSSPDFLWQMGNGIVRSGESFTYQYPHPGEYTVTLDMYDPTTRSAGSLSKTIRVGRKETFCKADFSYAFDEVDSMKVVFTNTSENYSQSNWIFGDGKSTQTEHPEHSYLSAGNYHVCLNTRDSASQCQSSVCKDISLSQPEAPTRADFSYTVLSDHYSVLLRNQSQHHTSSFWTVEGDTTSIPGIDTLYSFSGEGLYRVCMSAENSSSIDKVCKMIKIGDDSCELHAGFNFFVDNASRELSFVNRSSGTYHLASWNFGDGTTSTSLSPARRSYMPGTYVVGLSIKDTMNACTDYISKQVSIGDGNCEGDFVFIVDKDNPKKVHFENRSIGYDNSYMWNFGDGNTAREVSPVHTYARTGTYAVVLTLSNADHTCSDKQMKVVEAGNTPCMADFIYFIDSNDRTVFFMDQSIGDSLHYHWTMGDGSIKTQQHSFHEFLREGYYTVRLSIREPQTNCVSEITKTLLIGRNNNVKSRFTHYVKEDGTVVFSNKSEGEATGFLWNFGDRSEEHYTENTDTLTRYYEEGRYTVCLTALASGDISDITCENISINIPNEEQCKAAFTFVVDEEQAHFINYTAAELSKIRWRVDGVLVDSTFDFVAHFADSGFYHVALEVETEKGCRDAAHALVAFGRHQYRIKAGYAYEELEKELKVSGYPVDFVGISHGDANKIRWDFGDGGIDSTTVNPTHYYESPGAYTACFTIEDPVTGLSDQYCELINVGAETSIKKVQTIVLNNTLNLYPVPAYNYITVEYEIHRQGISKLYLIDAAGSVVDIMQVKNMEPGVHTITIPLEKYPAGQYKVVLQTEGMRQVKGFVKE